MIQIQKQKRKPEPAPKEFIEDCKELEPNFEKAKPKVQKIYKKWIGLGKNPQIIGKWLRPILRQWYAANSVWRLVPKEAHRSYVKDGSHSKKHIIIDTPKLSKMDNLATSSTVESPKENITPRSESLPKTTKVKSNLSPDEYDINSLEEYDKEYLISIIKWLHKNNNDLIQGTFKWQARLDSYKKKISDLEAGRINLVR